MKRYVLALDQGTTSSRSVLFDLCGNIIAMSQEETSERNSFNKLYPVAANMVGTAKKKENSAASFRVSF